MENENSIRLLGRISRSPVYDHTVLGEAFFKTEVAARRLSGTEDILPVTVSERLLGDPEEHPLSEGSLIAVSGQLRSYNRTDQAGSHLIITVFAREAGFPEEEPETDENSVLLTGHICKPVVFRTTPFMREIADLLIAVGRRYGKSDYLPAIAWGRNARFAGELVPGDAVRVRGRMQSRAYRKQVGEGVFEDRVAYEVSCSSIEKLNY
ncbi:MAG: single-stranded DNA-binding protein [Clostridia bacterium]|nr:single-stranded DNA-binding protein [Clostridia bacterium]